MAIYRVVQPWGRKRGRDATTLSEHSTLQEAFAEVDRLAEQMRRTGVPSDAIETLVVNSQGEVIPRPFTH